MFSEGQWYASCTSGFSSLQRDPTDQPSVMTMEMRVGPSEFEKALGLPAGRLDDRTRQLLGKAQLRFLPIDEAGQSRLHAEVARQIAEGFTVVGEHRAGIWRDAWQEQLEHFEKSDFELEALNPKFVAGSAILRWQGAYIEGITPRFELVFLEILRDWLFRTFLADIDHLYEFGSGSAFNVAAYAGLFPSTPITALDWAPAAVRIAELLRERRGLKITGRKFDFFSPGPEPALGSASGALTMCALEQTGERFGPFIEYLLANRPRRVVHVEPTLELYDAYLPHDRLAIEYHTQRKYLKGLSPTLRHLESEGKVRIPFQRRLGFGSRFHECFTVTVWEPA